MATNIKKQNTKLRVIVTAIGRSSAYKYSSVLPDVPKHLRGFRLSWLPEFKLDTETNTRMWVALGNYWSWVFPAHLKDKGVEFNRIGMHDCYKLAWRKKSGPHVVWTMILNVHNGEPEFIFDLNYGWLHARRLLNDPDKARVLWKHNHEALKDHVYTLFSEQIRKLLLPSLGPVEDVPKNRVILDAQIAMALPSAKIRKILLTSTWGIEDRKKLNARIQELQEVLAPLARELKNFKPYEEVTRLPNLRSK